MTAEAFSRPVCTATICGDDTVRVTVDGAEQVCGSMSEAITCLAATAGALRRPIRVTACDHSSTQPEARLIIGPDGSVTEETPARGAKRASGRTPPTTSRPEPAAPAPAPAVSVDAGPVPAAVSVPTPAPAPVFVPTRISTTGIDGPSVPVLPDTPARPFAPLPQAAVYGHEGGWLPQPVVLDPGDPRLQLPRETRSPATGSPAKEGWRGWTNTVLRTKLGPGGAEQRNRHRRTRIQRPLDTHRTMAVVDLKGGATKTTLTYHLAATYGRIRGGNILAGEVNENQGTLAERAMPGTHERTTLDLIRNLDTVTRHTGDLVRFVRPQGDDRIHVLASPPEGADRSRVDGTSVKAAVEVLRSLYNLILLDTGNSAQASTWQAAVEVADSLVFVAQNKEDDCRLLEATVEAVTAQGQAAKLARSILVVTNTAHPNRERLARLTAYAGAIGLAATITVPFDPSLQEGRAFDYDALNPATRTAYEEATAALTDQL